MGDARAPSDGTWLREPTGPPEARRDPAAASRLRRRARVLRAVAGTCLALPVLAAVWAVQVPWSLVVGGVVVAPAAVAALLAGAGTSAAFLAWVTGSAARDLGARPGSGRWFVGWPVNLGKAVLPAVGWGATAVVVLVVAIHGEARVLGPASDAGCRVVVREGYSAGTVLLLPPGSLRPVEVDAYRWDDGSGPVALGGAALRWDGEVARLELRGTAFDPVTPSEPLLLDCAAAARR